MGPNPSEASVEDGEDTQSLRKSPLPTLKVSSSSKAILPEGKEHALAFPAARTVAAPAEFASKSCGLSNWEAMAVTEAIRDASSADRGTMLRCGST